MLKQVKTSIRGIEAWASEGGKGKGIAPLDFENFSKTRWFS